MKVEIMGAGKNASI